MVLTTVFLVVTVVCFGACFGFFGAVVFFEACFGAFFGLPSAFGAIAGLLRAFGVRLPA